MRVVVRVMLAFMLGMGTVSKAVYGEEGAPDVLSIMQRSYAAINPHSEKALYQATLYASGGAVEQVRTFEVYYQRQSGIERTLQKFLSPPVLEGTGLLIVDSGQPNTDTWLYLPTTRRIRRIAGQDKSGRYMGTEFAYEDLEGYRIAQHRFSYVDEKRDEDGNDCYIIDSVAKTPSERAASGYSKKRYWIEQRTLYPVHTEYYAKDGSLKKRRDAKRLYQVGTYWRAHDDVMKDLQNGRSTALKLQSDTMDTDLRAYYVSKRYLRSE